jgi:hypothetical protein
VGGTITCEVSVDYPDQIKELELKINLSAVPMKVRNAGSLAFDDNKIPGYPNYNTTPKIGIPWKYLNYGETGTVEAVTKGTKLYYSTHIGSESPYMAITPLTFSSNSFNELSLNFNNLTGVPPYRKEADIYNCDPSQTFLKVFAAFRKNIQVRFFQVCELDDDIQVNLGTVASPDDVCIDPGPDGKYDGERELYDKVQRQEEDRLRIINGYNIVVAGDDKRCSTRKMGNNPDTGISTAVQEPLVKTN